MRPILPCLGVQAGPRDTIRLLRNFDEEVFKKKHAAKLMEEDDRLEVLGRADRGAYIREE